MSLIVAICFFIAACSLYYLNFSSVLVAIQVIAASIFFGIFSFSVFKQDSDKLRSDKLKSLNFKKNAIFLLFSFGVWIGSFLFFSYLPLSYDLSFSNKFSLSPKAVQIINQLKESFTIYQINVGDSDSLRKEKDFLKMFSKRVDGKKIQIVKTDPISQPDVVQKFQLERQDRLIVEKKRLQDSGIYQKDAAGKTYIKLQNVDEEALITAFRLSLIHI